ncbi:MAG: HNH endonuclease signature motif containing protein [Gemmataceae bacterium]
MEEVPEHQEEIEGTATQIYETLFKPPLKTPIKTLDIPPGGRGYGTLALPLVYDLVNLANDQKVKDATRQKILLRRAGDKANDPDADTDGSKTVTFLKNTRKVAWRISGTHPSSLGLHPAVYFFSPSGRFQPTSFLAVVSLIRDMDKTEGYSAFTDVRRQFEEFLIGHKGYVNAVTNRYGSGVKGFERLKQLYQYVIDHLVGGRSGEQIEDSIKTHSQFAFAARYDLKDEYVRQSSEFDTYTKSTIFIREAMKTPVRCAECGGLIHVNSMTIDHTVRKQDGGHGTADNGQLMHPYCNSTYKEQRVQRERAWKK